MLWWKFPPWISSVDSSGFSTGWASTEKARPSESSQRLQGWIFFNVSHFTPQVPCLKTQLGSLLKRDYSMGDLKKSDYIPSSQHQAPPTQQSPPAGLIRNDLYITRLIGRPGYVMEALPIDILSHETQRKSQSKGLRAYLADSRLLLLFFLCGGHSHHHNQPKVFKNIKFESLPCICCLKSSREINGLSGF